MIITILVINEIIGMNFDLLHPVKYWITDHNIIL